ncbi:unnamed protein product [Moneuplotes crassus]|uniref:Uncharacterized protein n=1 Tax=Euplotes crassus TaxID=5936 RepID=A0AAD1XLN7_EUPCR|nr:unnamed protein product [Moneuplotes crassus]
MFGIHSNKFLRASNSSFTRSLITRPSHGMGSAAIGNAFNEIPKYDITRYNQKTAPLMQFSRRFFNTHTPVPASKGIKPWNIHYITTPMTFRHGKTLLYNHKFNVVLEVRNGLKRFGGFAFFAYLAYQMMFCSYNIIIKSLLTPILLYSSYWNMGPLFVSLCRAYISVKVIFMDEDGEHIYITTQLGVRKFPISGIKPIKKFRAYRKAIRWADEVKKRVVPIEATTKDGKSFVYYLDKEGTYYNMEVMKAILANTGVENVKYWNPETGNYEYPNISEGEFKGIAKIATLPYTDTVAQEL